jgi:hypothetical protein
MIFNGEFVEHGHLNVRVEFLELAGSGFSTGSFGLNVFLGKVEVGAKVADLGGVRVVKCDGGGTRKNEILSSLNAETAHADDEDFHLDELAHGFEAKGTDLAGVKVSVDLDFFCSLHIIFGYFLDIF